jgi:hypothetical protein
MSVKMVDKDRGAKALVRRMQLARTRKSVAIGVFEDDAERDEEGEATNLDVAAFAELGTATSPPRPWLAPFVDENDADNRQRLRKIGEYIVLGKIPTVEVGLEQFGLYARGWIQRRIRDGIPPPNEPSTILAKGSSTPLIATGQFWSSITHRVNA